MFLALCGASVVLRFGIGLLPEPPPPPPPPRRPGEGIVMDVEATDSREG
jgi:hypothetical protein